MPADEREALVVLGDLAHDRTRPLPADLVAGHVLAGTGQADWPVQRAALELLRRRPVRPIPSMPIADLAA